MRKQIIHLYKKLLSVPLLKSLHKETQPIMFKRVASVKQSQFPCCNDDFTLKKFFKLLLTTLGCARQTALGRQDFPRTYLAHHELESEI